VEQLAAQACLPPRTLARVFQRELGTTPPAMWNARLEAATALLSQRQASVATVARLCGFGHPETLRRSFQRHLAISPQAFAERFGAG
jgi:transcriptional regulator GlxA family with amidase domain